MPKGILIFIYFFLFSSFVFAIPESFNLTGRVLKSDDTSLEAPSVDFTIEVLSPGAEACVLFKETHNLNMTGSRGIFSLPLGTGTRSGVSFEDTSSLSQAFDNSVNLSTLNCSSGNSYNPTVSDTRNIRISFNDGTGVQTLTYSNVTRSVPYSLYADKVGGKSASELLQLRTSGGYQLSQTNLEEVFSPTNYTKLNDLLAGTSSLYLNSSISSAFSVNSQKLTNLASPTDPNDAANKTYVDSNVGGNTVNTGALAAGDSGKVLTWDGAKWVAGAAGAVTDNSKLPLDGSVAMSGNLNMGNQNITNANNITLSGDATISGAVSIPNDIDANLVSGGSLILGQTSGLNIAIDGNEILARNNGSTSSLFLQNAGGQVEIGGTTSVSLDSGVTSGSHTLFRSFRSTGSNYGIGLGYLADGAGEIAGMIRPTGSGTPLAFANDLGVERMRISSDGNVGVGTTSPGFPLEVVSAINVTGFMTRVAGQPGISMIGYYPSIGFNSFYQVPGGWSAIRGGQYTGVLDMNPVDGTIGFKTGNAPTNDNDSATMTNRMVISNIGNVGIGTASPSSILDINGAETIREIASASAPVADAGKAFIYADNSTHTLKLSINGGGYNDILTSGTSGLGDITGVTAGAGLTTGGTSGDVTLDIGAGTGIVVNANDVAVDVGTAAGKIVQVQTGGKLPALDASDLTNIDAGDISAGTLAVARGGTGQTTYTDGQLLIGNSTGNTLTKATLTAGSGINVTNGGGSISLSSTLGSSVDLASAEVTGTLPVANGGTGATSLAANNVLLGNGTSAVQVVAPGTSGNVLTSNGSTWESSTLPSDRLSSLQNANATNTLANANNPQIWNWDTITTGTAFSLGSTSLTTGNILLLEDSNNSASSTGNVLKVKTTGALSNAVPLMVTNEGNGSSFRVNDDGTDTDTTPFIINGIGSVGVGTTAPAQKLHIYGPGSIIQRTETTSSNGLAISSMKNDSTGQIDIGVYGSAASGTLFGISQSGLAAIYTNQTLAIGSGAAAPVVIGSSGMERMRVHSDGNVGIGTTSPISLLHINNSSTSNTATTQMLIQQSGIANINSALRVTAQSSGDAFRTSIVNNGTEHLAITSAGNVGIGTTSPGKLLVIEGQDFNAFDPSAGTVGIELRNVAAAPVSPPARQVDIAFSSDGAGSTGRYASISGVVVASGGASGQRGDIVFSTKQSITATAVTERMRILSSGNVGIGTTTPGYKLDVQGGDINASGSVRSAGIALTSDIRYKRDIEPLDNALEKILNIRGVSYNWRTEEFPQKHFNDRHQIGVIAQEVEQQFPEVVDTNKDGYKSVNYPALVAPLIEAVKTLYNRLTGVEAVQVNQAREIASKADKAEMEALKAKNQKLEQENVAIKAYLCAKDPKAAICK